MQRRHIVEPQDIVKRSVYSFVTRIDISGSFEAIDESGITTTVSSLTYEPEHASTACAILPNYLITAASVADWQQLLIQFAAALDQSYRNVEIKEVRIRYSFDNQINRQHIRAAMILDQPDGPVDHLSALLRNESVNTHQDGITCASIDLNRDLAVFEHKRDLPFLKLGDSTQLALTQRKLHAVGYQQQKTIEAVEVYGQLVQRPKAGIVAKQHVPEELIGGPLLWGSDENIIGIAGEKLHIPSGVIKEHLRSLQTA